MTLANLGPGGFSVTAGAGQDVGKVMRFRFSTPDGAWATLLSAQTVYSRPDSDAPSAIASFVNGFKFLNLEAPRIAENINALIDRAMAVISFS
jgi:hypothetical protein